MSSTDIVEDQIKINVLNASGVNVTSPANPDRMEIKIGDKEHVGFTVAQGETLSFDVGIPQTAREVSELSFPLATDEGRVEIKLRRSGIKWAIKSLESDIRNLELPVHLSNGTTGNIKFCPAADGKSWALKYKGRTDGSSEKILAEPTVNVTVGQDRDIDDKIKKVSVTLLLITIGFIIGFLLRSLI